MSQRKAGCSDFLALFILILIGFALYGRWKEQQQAAPETARHELKAEEKR